MTVPAPTTTDETTEPAAPTGQPRSRDGSEAAKYRTRLRETEAERDALASRVETMQRAEVERLAGQHIAKGAAIWATGATLADLVDEGGNISPEKVTDAAQAAADGLGLAAATRTPRPDPSIGGYSEGTTPTSWSEALRR